jgi:hypothetical protein
MSEIYALRRRAEGIRAIVLPSPFPLSGWAKQQANQIQGFFYEGKGNVYVRPVPIQPEFIPVSAA